MRIAISQLYALRRRTRSALLHSQRRPGWSDYSQPGVLPHDARAEGLPMPQQPLDLVAWRELKPAYRKGYRDESLIDGAHLACQ
jgi:hypothetical protein